MADILQWMIYPTPETYAEVPETIRPTPTQCFVPHMPAVDLVLVPAFRDMLCNRLQDWITPATEIGLNCNWPYTTKEAFETDPVSGSMKISKDFAEHVGKSEVWSISSYGLSLYPELAGKVRIEDG